MQPRTITLGEKSVTFPSAELKDIKELDSSPLLAAKDFEGLRKRLDEDGFLYLKGCISRDKVLAARKRVLQALEEKGDVLQPGTETVLLSRCGAGCIPFMEGRNAITHSPEVSAVVDGDEIRGLTAGVLGVPDDGLLTLDYKWVRAMWRQTFTGAHMDRVYMSRGSPRLLTTWIPFSDATLELGALAMCRASHRLPGFHRLQATYGELDTERDRLDGTGWFGNDPFELAAMDSGAQWYSTDYAAGDVVLFPMRTLHMSTANLTEHVRISADVRWQPAADAADPRYVGAVDPSQRVKAGAWADDKAGAGGADGADAAATAVPVPAQEPPQPKVTMHQLRVKWGFDAA